MKNRIISKLMVLILLSVAGVGVAQAQVTERLKANIPFSFYVGDKQLPAGEYVIQVKDPLVGVIEVSSVRGKEVALCTTHNARMNSAPAHGELIFDRYGDMYFLERVFEQGETDGDELIQSRLEKKLEKEGGALEAVVFVE